MSTARFNRERTELALRLDEVIRASLSDARIPDVDDRLERVYGDSYIGRYPESREMRFFLENVAAFTPDLINKLLALVVGSFPRWTVVPQSLERVFTVSADGIDFDGNTVRGPVSAETPAYREWLARTRDYDEQRHGLLRRQLAWLLPRVPAALEGTRVNGATALGLFDGLEHAEPGPAIWLLLRRDWDEALPDGVEALRHGFPVDTRGVVYPRYIDLPAGADPFGSLASYHLPAVPGASLAVRRNWNATEFVTVPTPELIVVQSLLGRST